MHRTEIASPTAETEQQYQRTIRRVRLFEWNNERSIVVKRVVNKWAGDDGPKYIYYISAIMRRQS